MSKYIRTEDRIIDTEKEFSSLVTCGTKQEFANLLKKNFNCVYVSDDDKNIHANCGGEQIKIPYVSKSDNIKRLFDHLVIDEKDDSVLPRIIHRCLGAFVLDRCTCEGFEKNELEIYGSIWVNGNLIKVAKMNKKGEFELL